MRSVRWNSSSNRNPAPALCRACTPVRPRPERQTVNHASAVNVCTELGVERRQHLHPRPEAGLVRQTHEHPQRRAPHLDELNTIEPSSMTSATRRTWKPGRMSVWFRRAWYGCANARCHPSRAPKIAGRLMDPSEKHELEYLYMLA